MKLYNTEFGIEETDTHSISTDQDGVQAIVGAFTAGTNWKNGIYTLECTVEDTINAETLEFDIGIVPRAARASSAFYYGVQPYITKCVINSNSEHRLSYQDDVNTNISKFATIDYMGCNMIRDEITSFGNMWTAANTTIDPSINESVIKTADKLGMTYLWLATGSPAWAVDTDYTVENSNNWKLPPDATYWEQYMKAVGNYYKDYDNIIFEIWNEADGEFMLETNEAVTTKRITKYLNLLDIAVTKLKAASSSIRILPSALVSENRFDYFSNTSYIDNIKSGKLLGLNFHDHHQFEDTLTKYTTAAIEEFTNLGYTEGQFKNSWITESGVSNKSVDANGNPELNRAQTLTNKMLFYRGTGANSFVTWQFCPTINGSDTWSLFSDTLEPQVGVIAWTYQVGLLGNSNHIEHYAADSGKTFADIYYDGEKTVIPFYSTGGATDTITVSGEHKVYDMYGNESETKESYNADKSCIYIVFEGEKDGSAFTLS